VPWVRAAAAAAAVMVALLLLLLQLQRWELGRRDAAPVLQQMPWDGPWVFLLGWMVVVRMQWWP